MTWLSMTLSDERGVACLPVRAMPHRERLPGSTSSVKGLRHGLVVRQQAGKKCQCRACQVLASSRREGLLASSRREGLAWSCEGMAFLVNRLSASASHFSMR